jgi:hypothetical protein
MVYVLPKEYVQRFIADVSHFWSFEMSEVGWVANKKKNVLRVMPCFI